MGCPIPITEETEMNKPIILTDGKYRVAIPAHANLIKVVRWMRVCGYKLKWRNGWMLQEVRHATR